MNITSYRSKSYGYFIASISIIVLSQTFSSGALAEKVYKWVDDSGTIHYSDIKPNDQDSTSIKVSGGKASRSAESLQDGSAALSEEKAREQQKREQLQKEKAKKNETQSLCQSIRDNLKTLEEKSRVKINENGQLRYLTPEEINNKKADYKRTLAEQC